MSPPEPSPPEFSKAAVNLVELVDAALKNPLGWLAVKGKMLAGVSMPLSKLAAELGFASKQSLHYHLLSFSRQCPAVAKALPMDRRCSRHRPSPYYEETPPWIDNEKRKKRARVGKNKKSFDGGE